MTRVALAVVTLLLSACAHHLAPGPGAQVVDTRGKAVAGSASGVTITALPDAWRGFPRDLDGIVTPLRVTIDNQSGRPLRIRHEQFALRDPAGTRYAAHTPYEIDGYVQEPVAALPYAAYAAYPYDPYWHRPFGWGPTAWTGPFGWYDPLPAYARVRLPTSDMVREALAETVLEPGARATGFVYFDRATKKKGAPLDFTMDLVDARTGESFGEVRIPFVVK
jgi:hypothetical protein